MRRALWVAAFISALSGGLWSIHRGARTVNLSSVHGSQSLQHKGTLKSRSTVVAAQFQSVHAVIHRHLVRPVTTRVRLLARLIQAEAGDQSYPTEVAVGAVVVHRLRSPHFPHHLLGVITQPYQFSVVAAGTFARAHPTPRALRAARAALVGVNPAPGTFYFYNPLLTHIPWMNALAGCRAIGALRFCAGPH